MPEVPRDLPSIGDGSIPGLYQEYIYGGQLVADLAAQITKKSNVRPPK